jgi:hypothetical protein
MRFFLLPLLVNLAASLDLSSKKALRINAEEFSQNLRGLHVLPSPDFFKQQLRNMCQSLQHEGLDFFLCHHLAVEQKYVLPILEHHEDGEADEHVFMLELLPKKIYVHEDVTVAITSAEAAGELRVLVPRAAVPADRLRATAEAIFEESR